MYPHHLEKCKTGNSIITLIEGGLLTSYSVNSFATTYAKIDNSNVFLTPFKKSTKKKKD